MIDFNVLPAFFAAAVAICLAPGPDQAFIVAAAGTGGRRAGIFASAGMAVGIAVHTTLAALGLAAVLGASPTALQVVRVVGAGYLAYLAWATFRSLRSGTGSDGNGPPSVEQFSAFRRGLLVNLTNPKIILFFASFLPQFVGSADAYAPQFLMLGAVFLIVGFVIDAGIGIAAGQLRESSSSNGRARAGLTLLAGTTYSVLAALLVAQSI
ncbi:LysE family translocator [Nocardioides pantholopis]|uniref:LysE family translocator n=1 Tax=Nocardioides pantholopis TaxID=2483798 RepID=UPI000F08B58E|nr:LysE family translocator [Nocardioides pantholopis]